MKNWDEAKEGMAVYIINEIKIYDDEDNLIGKTKPFQKTYVRNKDIDEIMVVVKGGKFEGCDIYFHPKRDSPSELLTSKEFKELKMIELKVWRDLKKFISIIDKLNEKSENILMVRNLIEKNNIY